MVGTGIVAIIVLVALFAPLIAPYAPNQVNLMNMLAAPSSAHWFGTDDLGRDLLSRIIYGARTSLLVSGVSVAIGMGIGVTVGLISGYFGGWVDEWLVMRIVDAVQAFPFLIFALVVGAMLGGGLENAMIAIGVGFVPGFVRIARAQVLVQIRLDYVASAMTTGAGWFRIIFINILPNILTPVIVQATLGLASGIVAEASLSYLGLGVQPPAPSWGAMLHSAQGYLLTAPWMSIYPGLALVVAVLGFNYFGDGLGDVLNRSRS